MKKSSQKKVNNIYKNFSALTWKEDDLYVAKCLEIEVVSQGKNKNEALDNLKEALELYFQDEPVFDKIPIFDHLSLKKISVPYA